MSVPILEHELGPKCSERFKVNSEKYYDYIVLGAGVVGLTIARELKGRELDASVLVIDKEQQLGLHASGRNSGVLHSGVYYPAGSIKAQVCVEGARAMAEYCRKHDLPILNTGKVIVPTHEENDSQVDLLYQRAQENGARVELIDRQGLKEIEPEAHTASGRALYSPETAVVDPKAILGHLMQTLQAAGVEFRLGLACSDADPDESIVCCGDEKFKYGHLYNATGAYADRIAKTFGVGEQYVLIPFKGKYFRLRPDSGIHINGLVYPVPDLNVPFLGVHSVKSVHGDVYFGPSAIPALGRENYHGLDGVSTREGASIFYFLLDQYRRDNQGFRHLMHEESRRLFKNKFVADARLLIPRIAPAMLVASQKVGIRPQLLDVNRHELVMDFLVQSKGNTTHVLNAISPAFTCSLSFARMVVDTQAES